MLAPRVVAIALITLVAAPDALADSVDRRIRQLERSSNFKVRLSAAVSLGKSGEPRAVDALATALLSDRSATIRRVAIAGMVELCSSRRMSAAALRAALGALARAEKRDRDRRVRKSARRARHQLARMRRPPPRSRRGGLYLAVGKPADPRRVAPRGTPKEMLSTLTRTLRRHAPGFAVGSTHAAASHKSFFIGATVASMSVRRRGTEAEVKCQVAVRVSPYEGGRERFVAGKSASAKGTGRVTGGASARSIRDSKLQCVLAVVEQVTERQVLPFLRRLARR